MSKTQHFPFSHPFFAHSQSSMHFIMVVNPKSANPHPFSSVTAQSTVHFVMVVSPKSANPHPFSSVTALPTVHFVMVESQKLANHHPFFKKHRAGKQTP
jgi:hypothetical protein